MRLEKIREVFLEYFKKQSHIAVPSSSLIPGNDPTLLFTNAGMVQFKDAFLGKENLGYKRATSSQRCVRAGGKHNDLENVGYTARHHTFFEMLGNFSFGDYFKREAIAFAWEFLTVELKLPAEKLWVTVHSKDKETEQIWFDEMGISQTRFSRCGDKDNFWSMGDTGPCGYCTEIFYDHGPSIPGGPPGSPEEDGDRYVEIWNLVFMQYDRSSNGTLTPLPAPSVDTGMGIERLAAVMQGVQSNYDIDLFVNIIKAACDILEVKDERQSSLRVIADHIRSCSFLILDGVIPSNEGRGYVLRRIIRRAVRHGNHLGATEPFFYRLVAALVSVMGNAYPSLKENQALIERVLLQEEEQFAKTLETGLRILDQALISIPSGGVLSGEVAFKLYDTYGFPVDLTADILREKGMTVDQSGFEQAMNEQRDRARKSSQFEMKEDSIKLEGNTPFLGYERTEADAEIAFIYVDAQAADHVDEGQKAAIVLDETPFYAESGGQIGDKGHLITSTGEFFVEDTQKSGDVIVHYGHMIKGKLKLGASVKAKVDDARRQHIRRHHSATHLLHAALRKVLGPHVTQKGSLVDANRLRFDFSHMEALSENEIRDIESMVNAQIMLNSEVVTEIMTLEAAKQKGAMALFGEKYGETVRVLTMGDSYSIEFCGGTHVSRTGDIGLFKITSEMGVAAGIRRIEGVAGDKAMSLFMEQQALLSKAYGLLKCDKTTLLEKIENQFSKIKAQEKEIAALNQKLISGKGADISAEAIEKGGIKVLAKEVEVSDPKMLRVMLDQLKDKLGKAIIVLAARQDGKVSLVAGVTDNCTDRFSAGELIGLVAQEVGGKGGGRADMAQAGGTNPTNIPKALAIVVPWVENKL